MKGNRQQAKRKWLLAFALCLLPCALRSEPLDRVLAVVNGRIITLTDATAARDFGLVAAAPGGDPMASIVKQLVDRALVLAEVERYAPPEPSAEDVEHAFEKARSRFATPRDFDAALERSGVDDSFVRNWLRNDLRIEAYERQRFTAATGDETAAGARRQALVDDWIAGLRRRADISEPYLTAR
jgi:hypothetical protein